MIQRRTHKGSIWNIITWGNTLINLAGRFPELETKKNTNYNGSIEKMDYIKLEVKRVVLLGGGQN